MRAHPRCLSRASDGGLWGRTSWKWLTIELLFVPERYRGCGLGSEVMRLAEEEAIRRGCIGAWVDTHTYEASTFYEKQGFERFGLIDEYPPGALASCLTGGRVRPRD
ncbi:GNAT family N-acetyltransferase [Pseudoroseomonas wenyumeiae]